MPMLTLNSYRTLVDDAVRTLALPERPAGLYEPIRYTLRSGGKRLRPVMTVAAADACGLAPADAVGAAVALEMFHNFTLLHDDVMDNSDTRRGRPTVVARWGVPTAVLSGDCMLTLAGRLMRRAAPAQVRQAVMDLYEKTAVEVYEGQQLDMDMEGRPDATVADYLEMIRLKTSVLLGCACALGATLADAPRAVADALYAYGEALGMAFQLRDDLLDTFGDPITFGKTPGGDILNDKNTWLRLSLPAAQRPSPTLGGGLKIEAWKEAYTAAGLDKGCQALIDDYTARAVRALADAGLRHDAVTFFSALAEEARTRAV